MITFRDKTFCASPNCNNECGRKMSDFEKAQLFDMAQRNPDECLPVSYGYFCGDPCSHEMHMSSFLVTACKLCGEIEK
jgi:hypothetical protein